jgi:two-component system sensor histidine kinase DegS
VANLAAQAQARWGMEVELVCALPGERYASGLETAVFRMVQEALANVRAHARTRKARVELAQQGESLRAEVRDWGAGFDPRQAPAGHYGLEGIHERVRLLGGRVTVRSAPGEGTLIAVELPVRGA